MILIIVVILIDLAKVYNEKYLKAKIKYYINANFNGDKISKEGFQSIFLPVISIHFVFRTSKIECFWISLNTLKEKIPKYFTEKLQILCDDKCVLMILKNKVF